MSYIFGTNVDFNLNETLNQRLENQLSFPTLTGSDTGYVFYHTANQKFYGWDGTSWLDFTAAGGGGAVDSVFGRTGAVIAVDGDYDSFYLNLGGGQLTGNITFDANNYLIGNTAQPLGNLHSRRVYFEPVSPATRSWKVTANNSVALYFEAETGAGTDTHAVEYSMNLSGTPSLTTDLIPKGWADTNLVDKTSTETIGGLKSFSSAIHAQAGRIIFNDDSSTIGYASGGSMGYLGLSQYYFHQDHVTVAQAAGILDFDSLTADRIYTWPDKAGTVAMLSDVTGGATISDIAYDATSWNGNTTDGASKNAIRDQIELMPKLSAVNTFTGARNDFEIVRVGNYMQLDSQSGTLSYAVAGGGTFYYKGGSVYRFSLDGGGTNLGGLLDFSNITGTTGTERTYSFPDETGTVALSENTVNITGNQLSIAGLKVFTSATRYQSPNQFDSMSISGYASGGAFGYLGTSRYFFTKDTEGRGAIFDFGSISAGAVDRTYTFPNKDITIAEYQSGTWTPTIVANGTASYTYSVQNGTYRRAGDIVMITCDVVVSSTSGTPSSAALNISGLPFNQNTGTIVPMSVYMTAGLSRTNRESLHAIMPTDNLLWITTIDTTGGAVMATSVKNNDLSSSFAFRIAGTYWTNAT